MTDSITGALGPIYLDRKLLDKVAIEDGDLTVVKLMETATLARGNARQAIAHQGADGPIVGEKRRLLLRHSNLGSQYDLVEELLGPGAHEVVTWKRAHPKFAGNGVRRDFTLPWRIHDHFTAELPVPPNLTVAASAGRLSVEIRVGIDGTAMPVTHQDQATFDAGYPAAGEAWFLEQGFAFKVGTAPAAGERLYVRCVPLLLMFEEPVSSKKYPAASQREPLDLVLVEQ